MPLDTNLFPTKRIKFDRTLTLDGDWIRSQVLRFFSEDAPHGDLTTESFVPPKDVASADIIAGETSVFAGTEVLRHCFFDLKEVNLLVEDGDTVEVGTILATLHGSARDILTRERVVLNLLQRLCGIATNVKQYIDIPAPEGFIILDTRKTTPGLRKLEKYAVAVGGAYNHRMDLSSAILIKDNHIVAAGGLKNAEAFARSTHPDVPVELEIDSIDQIEDAQEIELDGFLLDNMNPKEVEACVNLIRSFPNGESIFIEASGGINLETFPEYAWTGIDAVSIGALTTSAQNIDLRLDLK